MFLGQCASHDVVSTRFGHYVKLASTPGAVSWGLGYYNKTYILLECFLCPDNVFNLGNNVQLSSAVQVIIGVSCPVFPVLLCNLHKSTRLDCK